MNNFDSNHDVPSRLKSVENDVKSMREDIKRLLSNDERMSKVLEALLPLVGAAEASTSPTATPCDPKAKSAATKKKKRKKKPKGASKVPVSAIWGDHGNSVTITIGLLTIALLISMTLGHGRISLQKGDHHQYHTTKLSLVADSEDVPDDIKPTGNIDKESAAKQRATLGNSSPPTSSDLAFFYYAVSREGGYCDNDPLQRPSQFNQQLGTTLFKTAEECCNHWFSSREDNECMVNSQLTPHSSNVPEYMKASIPASASTISNSPTTDDFMEKSYRPSISTSEITNEDNLFGRPTFKNSPTLLPNTVLPTTLSPAYMCDAYPETCGCPDLFQSDYRGSIRIAEGGSPCRRWDADQVVDGLTPRDFPKVGLDENFCRNPNNDPRGPWCYTEDGSDYCHVPVCGALISAPTTSVIPTSTKLPSVMSPSISSLSSSSSAAMCQVADITTCGCDDVFQTDYTGFISETRDGIPCLNWGQAKGYDPKLYPDLDPDINYCRNPINDANGAWCMIGDYDWGSCDIPACDPCSCMPPCRQINNEDCGCPSFFQAEECCEDDDSICKCDYLKNACSKSLENNSTAFCDAAEDECCKGRGVDCKCGMYEKICTEFPSQSTCEFAADSCCKFDYAEEYCAEAKANCAAEICLCDFYTHVTNVVNYESGYQADNCVKAAEHLATARAWEARELKKFFGRTGGEHWFNKSGWLDDETFHCNWFGIKCHDSNFVSEINLRQNNLTGEESLKKLWMTDMKILDLAKNNLGGKIQRLEWMYFQDLEHVDISDNQFTGHVEMLFPAVSYVNIKHNNFTSVGFKGFNPSYQTLKSIDLSNNFIDQDALDVFLNIPPNLEEFILSDNAIRGNLPDPFPVLDNMKNLIVSNNNLSGPLPDFSASLPRLKQLKMAGQAGTGGFTGTLPSDISRLEDLTVLDLAGNRLSGDIPSGIGSLWLEVLDLSSNVLSRSIPTELGRLEDNLRLLDLSHNQLEDKIPTELGSLTDALVFLRGNADLSSPAPLTLCSIDNFDLANETSFCPMERNALQEIYYSAKGSEWTITHNWLDEYKSHCEWSGVECGEENNTIRLELPSNGLSGTLSERIGNLSSLKYLDLSDNDIKGSIPADIGLLSYLTHLHLSYNSFVDSAPKEWARLQRLEIISLHSNRISGTIPRLNLIFSDRSSYIADCGNPSHFAQLLECEECTMCCNAQGDCLPNEENKIKKVGFDDYLHLTWVFFLCLFGVSCALAFTVFTYDKYKSRNLSTSTVRQMSARKTVNHYASNMIGSDSVYQFLLGTSLLGWAIALTTMAAQIGILFVFVQGAEIDLSDGKTDLIYTYRCPRDEEGCEDLSDLTLAGWVIFGILMVAHLLKDIIKGSKMIGLSARDSHTHDIRARIRFFFGGMLLTTVTCFTLYVSTIYNKAIATSNTDVVANSVIILFITDIDELFYEILMVIDSHWVGRMAKQNEQDQDDLLSQTNAGTGMNEKANEDNLDMLINENLKMKDKLKGVEDEMEELRQSIQRMKELVGIEETPSAPQSREKMVQKQMEDEGDVVFIW